MDTDQQPLYLKTFKGGFSGILRWQQLDQLWENILTSKKTWYVYAVGEAPPETALTREKLTVFLTELDSLLRKEHDEDYCGVVYVDDKEAPSFIKVFDPNNLGSSCSTSTIALLPAWIISTLKPIDLPNAFPQPTNRQSWWKRIFSSKH